VRVNLYRNQTQKILVVVVVMTGFYGAVEAGSELPVLSTLDTGGGSHREPLHPSSLLPQVENFGVSVFIT